MAELITKRTVREIVGDEAHEKEDLLLAEAPLTLDLNGKEFVTLLCTPESVPELVTGFLYSEGLIEAAAEVLKLEVDEAAQRVAVEITRHDALAEKLFGKRTITTGCGRGTIFYHLADALKTHPVESAMTVPAAQIFATMKSWGDRAELFKLTGCPHSAALATPEGEILTVKEDIGRHNAVDKVVGHALREGWTLHDKLLLTTGRVSSEILIKAARARIPVLVSRSAATALAVGLAEALGITAIGFVRGKRMNIYAGTQRVLL